MPTQEEPPKANQTEPRQPTSLLTLPPELRLQIYSAISPPPPTPEIVHVTDRHINRRLTQPKPYSPFDYDRFRTTTRLTSALQLTCRQLYLETTQAQYRRYAWHIIPQSTFLRLPGYNASRTKHPLPGSVAQLEMLAARIGRYPAKCIEEVHLDLLKPMTTVWNGGRGVGRANVDALVSRNLRPFGRVFRETFGGLRRLVVVVNLGLVDGIVSCGWEGERAVAEGPEGLDLLVPLSSEEEKEDEDEDEDDRGVAGDLHVLWDCLR